ncbi:MAG TPA: hypothetical protein VLT10_00210 [Verrucomicrobiae bacterium]|nr:hypothetical protein [Verrucomicrobiae bacterium]
MSKSNPEHKEFHSDTRDIFTESRQSFEKIRGNIEKTVPPYVQSMTNLSQEYFSAWANFVSSTIANQQNFAQKIGVDQRAPEASVKVVRDLTDEFVKAIDMQSKVALTVLDATRQATKAISDTTSSFYELNHNIVDSWISTWSRKN